MEKEKILADGLASAEGYMLNAIIDLETGRTKRDVIRTIDQGLEVVRKALREATAKE